MRPYKNWINKIVGKRVDMDNYPKYGKYQCVDLFKHYANNCLGMKLTKTGNAKEIGTNKYKIFDKSRVKMSNCNDLMQGDILVTTKWEYGHIVIFDHFSGWKVLVAEQNGSGKNSGSGLWANAIRIQWYPLSFFNVVWRSTKIMDNFQQEKNYVNQKLIEKPWDKNTLDYLNAIRYKK